MGQWLYDSFAKARETFEEASDSIGVNVAKLCFESDEATLARTENTQVAIVCVSTALFRCLNAETQLGVLAGAGHSVGEYSALVASGALGFRESILAVRTRGQAMQEAVPVGLGGMAAVMGLDLEQVKSLCAKAVENSPSWILEPANDNSPGQIVISGHQSAIDRLKEIDLKSLFPGARVKLIPLKVSAPFHCSLMAPAEAKMRNVLSEISFHPPRFPIVCNRTANQETRPEELRRNLIEQITASVLWTQSQKLLHSLQKEGVWIEFGTGQVLSGLAKKTLGSETRVLNLNSLDDFKSCIQVLEGKA